MKDNISFSLLIFLLLFFLIAGCNPTSSVNLLYVGNNRISSKSENIIYGRVLELNTCAPIIGANISIDDGKVGAATDVYGNYTIRFISNGSYRITVSCIGYEKIILNDFEVSDNKLFLIDFNLKSVPIMLP